MKELFLVNLLLLIYVSVCTSEKCENLDQESGSITDRRQGNYFKCWFIEVPEDSYVLLSVINIEIVSWSCSSNHLNISVAGSKNDNILCSRDKSQMQILALNDVTITFRSESYGYESTFTIQYSTENLLCAQKNSFRCSNHFCIHKNKVCDGKKDCENGLDEDECKKGINIPLRENTLKWLMGQRTASYGWGADTHRAITALYLSGDANFQDGNLEDNLMAKQLELQAAVTLLRNSTNPLSISELSMYINALLVTCHNPRHFYGENLLKILGDRVDAEKSPNPGAYLALCNGKWDVSRSQIMNLVSLVTKNSGYPFHLDIQAIAMMALSCLRQTPAAINHRKFMDHILTETLNAMLSYQKPDGSFGNVYTTAFVTQALISLKQQNDKRWNMTSAVEYLEKHLDSSSIDFLSTYLTLPIYNNKSLASIASVKCSNIREQDGDDEMFDLINKLGGKLEIKYSLYIGDDKEVKFSVYLKMAENSTAYDVMRMAQLTDSRYKFSHTDVSGSMYIYEISGFTNDPEAGRFWLLYSGELWNNTEIRHYTESPDKYYLTDGEHLIMWYKTTSISVK